ncbi:MAG: hypothetical protein FXV79_01055 [Candidatus Thioglobus sp.]|nr:MAG: hypothetical protein FXV80_02755 [Candidatus Thioglobus sp.]KAA0455927.1 MAG: hypothetical protein FXV79_01055 [Candidatus Thioglobus sp.]
MINYFKIILLSALLATFAVTAQADGSWRILSLLNSVNKPNFEKMDNIKQIKTAFFNYLLPIIKEENNKIRTLRSLIISNQISKSQLQKLAKKYHIKRINKEVLLEKVDTIPASLALAQAAIESDWGRSRFAKYWNNYFGIWCFSKGCGIQPENRNKNAKHEVKNFASSNKSIEYYLLNINRNHNYKLLRQIRAYKRKHNLKLTGKSLSEGLDKYSATGYEYIVLIQSIIRQNNLTRFD